MVVELQQARRLDARKASSQPDRELRLRLASAARAGSRRPVDCGMADSQTEERPIESETTMRESPRTICDQCGEDITSTGNCEGYRLVVESEFKPSVGASVTMMAVAPPIDRPHHFCALPCLAKWISAKPHLLTEYERYMEHREWLAAGTPTRDRNNCSKEPGAKHRFDRVASAERGRYVCVCESKP